MSKSSVFFPLLQAAAADNSLTSMLLSFVPIVLIFAVFYFLIIRPQQKKQKDAKAMLEALKRGDRIVTIGGLWGTIADVKEKTVILKVDDNTKLEYSRDAVAQVVKGEEVKSTP